MKKSCTAALLAGALLASPALAQMTVDVLPNMIGAGVGATTQYSGADEYMGGLLPGGRYQFKDSYRFVEWYGPTGDWNLIDSPTWQLGPALGLRFGRHNVKDDVVALLPEVDSTVEGGVMGSWTGYGRGEIPWRLRIGVTAMTDLGNTYEGINSTAFATFWLPLSRRVFVGLGGGASVASASYNRAFYGVSAEGAAASGLPAFAPGGGLRQWYAWPAVVWEISGPWFAGAGLFYQRIAGDPADSPIITQRGDRNQLTGGVGIGYVWK